MISSGAYRYIGWETTDLFTFTKEILEKLNFLCRAVHTLLNILTKYNPVLLCILYKVT